ncbi:GAF domain-containing protein [Pseudoblastomonas halimionae]|uniref:GAF domain-containing protein n=1 Tax=Alteriqipengyuania halimionae TaxID=1926630 RepID=A0A6I4U385_9SPHN|nr:GAF domain-containing protein [Alteriqipengyuania halimionae]MXP10388.1 GAF domain-containing protein [Alteriqipengyuania halimionae]
MEDREQKRLQTLHGYRLLDTLPEPEFDDIVRRAAERFDTPIALMSLVDADRQWFKAKVGLDVEETPRSVAFCAYTIQGDDVMVVEDATQDERFSRNPLVLDDPSIRFYAGAPVTGEGGQKLGTICVIDRKPRHDFSETDMEALAKLSAEVSRILASTKEMASSG